MLAINKNKSNDPVLSKIEAHRQENTLRTPGDQTATNTSAIGSGIG